MIADELLRWLSADMLCCRLIKVAGCSTAPGNNFLLIFCSDYWHSLAGLQMQTLSIRLPCLRILWNLSTCFPNLKIILQSGPSVFKVNLKRTVIFCKKNFSHLQPPQAGRAGTTSQVLNLIFYKSSFKTLVGLRPNLIFRTKLRWPHVSADTEYANFLGGKFVLWKSALIHLILHQTGTITSGFESKKRKYHFLKIWVLLWYALFRAVHRTGPDTS